MRMTLLLAMLFAVSQSYAYVLAPSMGAMRSQVTARAG